MKVKYPALISNIKLEILIGLQIGAQRFYFLNILNERIDIFRCVIVWSRDLFLKKKVDWTDVE